MGNTPSNMLDNHYQILGISRSASPREVKHAYYRLVRQTHPDKLASASIQQRLEAEESTKVLNEAYEVMSEPVARAIYDRTFLTRSYAPTTLATPPEAPAKKPHQTPEQSKQKQTLEQPQIPEKGARDPNSPPHFPGVVPHPSDYTFMAEDFLRNPPWIPKDYGLCKESNKANLQPGKRNCEEPDKIPYPSRPRASMYTAKPTSSHCDSSPETPEPESSDDLASESDDDAPMYEGLSPDEWVGLDDVSTWQGVEELGGWKSFAYRASTPYVYSRAPRCSRSVRTAVVVAKKVKLE